MSYTDNFETVAQREFKSSPERKTTFKIDRNRKSRAIKLHVREVVNTSEYTGHTKNGFSIAFETVDQVENFRTEVNKILNAYLNNLPSTIEEGVN